METTMTRSKDDNMRVSLLCDMLINHLIYCRIRKALMIALYLRRHFGMYLNMSLQANGTRVRR